MMEAERGGVGRGWEGLGWKEVTKWMAPVADVNISIKRIESEGLL